MFEGERALGATFALADIGFLDFETRSMTTDIDAGSYRYAMNADAIVVAYAINGPVKSVAVNDFSSPLDWRDMPDEVKRHHDRVEKGEAIWCAWNSPFDRAVWNFSTTGFPEMKPHHIIDAMVQATVAGLPPDLAKAAEYSHAPHKVKAGKELIDLFCVLPDIPEVEAKRAKQGKIIRGRGTPQTHPAEWKMFHGAYAHGDIHSMRSVFRGTRQLSRAEWEEFWASERVNERGIAVDLDMVMSAARLARENKRHTSAELALLTGGAITTVDQVQRIVGWLNVRLPVEGRDIIIKRVEETGDDGEIVRPAKHSLTRKRVEKLIAYAKTLDDSFEDVRNVLQIRLFGGSKTPQKFERILGQQIDGAVLGQYSFCGAPQTGRFSSRGVQIQNLARDALPYELDAIDAVLDNCSYTDLSRIGNVNDPVVRKLSLLIRPSFVPREGNVFVWSDWSQIEARVLPWLAGSSGGQARLDVFRAVDADPRIPDIYVRSASAILGIPIKDIDEKMRQSGKIVELAAGFGGSVGALQNMAANYGVFISDADAKTIIDRWRLANDWATVFWDQLWEAANSAMANPGSTQRAGRIHYTYLKNYLGGSLLCVLPSGRMLTYRNIKYERVADVNDDDVVTGYSTHLRCSRGHTRLKLWKGIFAENVTQACAADFLRGTIRRLEEIDFFTRLHSHDEILGEVPERQAVTAAQTLRGVMRQGFDWSEGLPLMSEETVAYHYSKNKSVRVKWEQAA